MSLLPSQDSNGSRLGNDDDDDDESSSSERMVIGSPASDFETDDDCGNDDDDVPMEEEARVETTRRPHGGSWANHPWPQQLLVWNGFQDVSLEEWIREHRPSRYSSEAGGCTDNNGASSPRCKWLRVYDVHRVLNRPPPAVKHLLPPDLTDVVRAQPDLSRYERLLQELACAMACARNPAGAIVPTTSAAAGVLVEPTSRLPTPATIMVAALQQRCVEAILALAKDDGCLAGKWMVFCDPAQADGLWETIAVATAHGKLGSTSKVSTTRHLLQRPENSRQAVMCVYVDDGTDRREVKRVLDVLRQDLGIATTIAGFKPDIYTYLGIYGGNPWGLRPALYTSREVDGWPHH